MLSYISINETYLSTRKNISCQQNSHGSYTRIESKNLRHWHYRYTINTITQIPLELDDKGPSTVEMMSIKSPCIGRTTNGYNGIQTHRHMFNKEHDAPYLKVYTPKPTLLPLHDTNHVFYEQYNVP